MPWIDIEVLERNMAEQRRFYFFEGILLLVLGLLAILLPMATALTVNMIVAVILILGGAARLVTASRPTADRGWKLLGGVLFLFAGIWMVINPMQGVGALVIFLGMLLVLEGVLEVATAYAYRPLFRSGWLMLSGILSLVLGLLLLTTINEAGPFLLAILVGINLLFAGVSVCMLAWAAGRNF